MEKLTTNEMAGPGWTFLGNHAYVLISIAADRDVRMRDLAVRIGITERAVQRIISELQDDGYLEITRNGRRNRYEVNTDRPLRHPIVGHRTAGHLIELGRGGRPAKR